MKQTKNSDPKSQDSKVAFGVEALIERLRNEGVGSGRAEAEKIVKDARAEAQTIVSKAKEEADQIVSRARTEAANLEKAGRQALEVAARVDCVLAMLELSPARQRRCPDDAGDRRRGC